MGRYPDLRTDQSGSSSTGDRLNALRSSDAIQRSFDTPGSHGSNRHVALIYETRTEQFEAVAPFVRHGLERDERCLYVADENSREEVLEAMRDRDIDVDAALDSGALTIHTKQDTYLRNGSFDPDEMIAYLETVIVEALEEYEALRITGEMTWVLDDESDVENLIEYEGMLNEFYLDVDAIGLCQYNRNRFPPSVIHDVIRTHPQLVREDWISDNLYYEPPKQFFDPDHSAREIDRIEATLAALAESQTERERRNDRLEEFASLVAHDLRAPLSVATGRLNLARKKRDSENLEELARTLDRMDELIGDFLALARGGRAIEDLEPVDPGALAERCWQNVAVENATLVTKTDWLIQADHNRLKQLMENLLRNGVDHGGDDVTITIGEYADGFFVADDGPGIPADERETVFETGYSTTEDGTGFGLRIVEEVADAHGWDVTVTEGEDGGARFEIGGVESVQ